MKKKFLASLLVTVLLFTSSVPTVCLHAAAIGPAPVAESVSTETPDPDSTETPNPDSTETPDPGSTETPCLVLLKLRAQIFQKSHHFIHIVLAAGK